MDGQTTFLDEFNATAPDLSREVNVIVYGGSTPGPTPTGVSVIDMGTQTEQIIISRG